MFKTNKLIALKQSYTFCWPNRYFIVDKPIKFSVVLRLAFWPRSYKGDRHRIYWFTSTLASFEHGLKNVNKLSLKSIYFVQLVLKNAANQHNYKARGVSKSQ